MVEIFDEYILLKNFYFLWMGAKKVAFSEVTEMRVIDLSFFDGRYRLQGTTNLKRWWPLDWKRPKRKYGCVIKRRAKWVEIGFTAEDFHKVYQLLQQKLAERFKDQRQSGGTISAT